MNWDDMLLGRDDRYSPAEWEAYKDRASTEVEEALALLMEEAEEEEQIEVSPELQREINEFRPNCPGGNDEEGGKAASARPTRMTCCRWLRKEKVLN